VEKMLLEDPQQHEQTSFRKILSDQWLFYPRMQVQELCKHIHQVLKDSGS
jgi:hypothetical protein